MIEDVQHWDNIFEEEFGKESDRASVILSAAMLDKALSTLIKVRLVPCTSQEDSLIGGSNTPLSSFRARIDIAHRLGLISSRLCRDLHIIRKIRNDFAHDITDCDFNSSSVRNRIIELNRSSKMVERNPKLRKSFPKGPKGDFQMTISWMLWNLWVLVGVTESLEPAIEEFGYDQTMDEKSVSRKRKKKTRKRKKRIQKVNSR